jgi:hypothetical protein
MAFDNEHEDDKDNELLLTDELPPEDEQEPEEQEESPEQEDDVLELVIEGEDDGNETELVKRLRDQLRSVQGENATLKKGTAPKPVEVGKKPDLWEDCDSDPDKFEAQLTAWHDRKKQAEKQEAEKHSQTEAQSREFERLKARHESRAAVLKIPDFEARQQAVVDALGPELAGAALVIADDSAKLVGALGANPAALAKIVDEPNPLLKLKMLMKMEARINPVKKKPPAPEAPTIQRGSAPLARKDNDKELARLEKEAEKTGKRDAVIAFKKKMKGKAA